ncbi:hypothetical protein H0H87_002554 [Tephrocybe sp. NHM501043]|nr:hypothetical protein H0H87_002554 [Tephrocybe sp. NHM501043]
MAMLLSVFEVDKGRDENGVEVQPRCEFSGGTVSHPLRFAYSIKPRSTAAEYLILTVLDEFPPRRGDGDSL